jgi:DNA-binding transcriptional ArsR family regulator
MTPSLRWPIVVATLLLVASAASVAEQACTPLQERCIGALGYPEVRWLGCCTGECIEYPSLGWGFYCIDTSANAAEPASAPTPSPAPNSLDPSATVPVPSTATCTPTNGRCQGASSDPSILLVDGCCDESATCEEAPAKGWGKFCVDPGSAPGAQISPAPASSFPQTIIAGWNTVETVGEPFKRHETNLVKADNGKAFLIGGHQNPTVYVFDIPTRTWTDTNVRPPTIMHHAKPIYYQGLIYVPAAWQGNYPYESNVPDFWAFNTVTYKWTKRTQMPSNRMRGSGATVLRNGKIYVAFGNNGGQGAHATTTGWLDIYDIATDTWTIGPTAPHARDHTDGAIIGNLFCVAGGRNGGIANFKDAFVLPTNCYNFSSNTWSVEKDIPVGRAGPASSTTCDGKMIVSGGERDNSALARVDYFDGTSWASPTYMNTGRHGHGLMVGDCTCGHIFVTVGSAAMGGFPEISSTEMFSLQNGDCSD